MPTRVLLVEDDAMISEALSLALADEDFAVTAAATGEDGLELLESAAVDVVLLDLMLPASTGSPSAEPCASAATCRSS